MRLKIESRWFDFDLNLFNDVVAPLDKILIGMYEVDPEEADMLDYTWLAEHLFGVGLVTAQVYINSSLFNGPTQKENSLSQKTAHKLGPKHSSGISIIKLIIHGANYWKHNDEWSESPLNNSRNFILNTFSSIGIGNSYPLYSLMEEITNTSKPRLGQLSSLLEEWHNALDVEMKKNVRS